MADLAQLLAQAQAQREAQNPFLTGAQSVQQSMANSFTPQNLKGVSGGDIALAAIAGALASGGMSYFGRKQEDEQKAAENLALAQALQAKDPAAIAFNSEVLRQHPAILLGLQEKAQERADKTDEQARLWKNLGYKKGANGSWEIDPSSPAMQRLAQEQSQLEETKRAHDLSNSIAQQQLRISMQQLEETKREHDLSNSIAQQRLKQEAEYQEGVLKEKTTARLAKSGGELPNEEVSLQDINITDHSDLNSIMTERDTAKKLGVYEQKTPGVVQSNAKAWDVFMTGAKGKPSATRDSISLDSVIKNIDILSKSDGKFRSDSGLVDAAYGAYAWIGGKNVATDRRAYDAIRLKVIEGDLSNLAPVTDVDLRSELNTALIGNDWEKTKQELAKIKEKLQTDSAINKMVLKFAGANPARLNNVSPAQIRAAARAMYEAKMNAYREQSVGSTPDDAAMRALTGE